MSAIPPLDTQRPRVATPDRPSMQHRVEDRFAALLLGSALALPYAWRVPFMGWFMSRVLAPTIGYRKRIRNNLAHVCPELSANEVARLCKAVPNNFGRSLIEMFSGQEFASRIVTQSISGLGLSALDAAHLAGRPVVLITGHIGNFDAPRVALLARGFNIGGLYKPMSNAVFNTRYERAIKIISTAVFPKGRDGLAGMIRFLRGGGMLGMVIDQHMPNGSLLSFMGRPAYTALSAVELALKYGALVVPAYGIRRENGLDFDVIVEAPIPEGSPETMTQALNDSLEVQVRAHMDQWLWMHRRWQV
jgi:KDO2-lipid IV(A) lauroyltransferase